MTKASLLNSIETRAHLDRKENVLAGIRESKTIFIKAGLPSTALILNARARRYEREIARLRRQLETVHA